MGNVFFGGGKVGMKAPSTSRLPKGDTELTYIQSGGTQYIKTGFKPNQNSRIVMDAQFVNANTVSKLYLPFGVRNGGYFFELYKASSNNWNLTFLWGTKYSNYFTFATTDDWNARHTFEINRNVATVDGTSKTNTAETFQLTQDIYLCADNNAGSANSVSPLTIYSCQIYDNDVLVRDFVPCMSDADGVGLYDLVNGVFYGNAGSGTFIGGEEVA